MDKILTVTDVAGILKVKEITVREMFREKRLRAFKMGKAWRTTEVMLQEDVAALARGEMPVTIPDAAPASPQKGESRPKKERKPRKVAEVAEAAAAEAVEIVEIAETVEAVEEPGRKKKVKAEKEKPDDTQQLLF